MGKQMRRKDSDVGMKENRPGCIWGIFQILDYHQWHTVKKILPNKWHTGERHGRSKHLNFLGNLEVDGAFDANSSLIFLFKCVFSCFNYR